MIVHTFPYHFKFITKDKRFRIYDSLQIANIQRGIDSHSLKTKYLECPKFRMRDQKKS